jgi:hypothetical protein
MPDKQPHDYEPCAGEHINNTCSTLVASATEKGRAVTADFNGVELRAEPGMSAGDVHSVFDREMKRRQDEYEAKRRAHEQTPEGKEELRKAEERRRYVEAEVAKGNLPFTVRDQAAWDTCVANNSDPYGACAVRYAARWAHYMERDLARGADLKEIVEPTSHEADIEGVTGFMHGCARSILQQVWEHGEALKAVLR